MKIKKSELMRKIRKEFKEGRRWCKQDWRRVFAMMIDTSDGDIWSDCFLDANTWKEYHSDTISKLTFLGVTVEDQEQHFLDEAVELLLAAGWEIEE